MEQKHCLVLVGCILFGILFSTISSQSTLCIGFCGSASTADPSCTNLPNYSCLNIETSANPDYACCPTPPERCIDNNVNCPVWAANGFCNNIFWTAQNKLSCRKSCGLCTPTSNSTCQDKNTTLIAFSNRNNTLCEVWARNGFCGSKTFYGAYIRQTCNASCGCTNITEPLTFCQQLAGRAADVGPFPCPTGVTGINVNGSCCVVPGTPAGSQLTCAAIHGENIGPCTVDATSTFSSCGGSDTCICPDTTALNCQCCRTRPNTKLSCQAVIGAFPPTLTPSPTGPAVQCTSNTQCTALNAQCIEGQCCQF